MMRQRQVELEIIEGVRKRYRSGAEIRLQKSNKMGKSLNTWFLRAGNTCTLSVQCTPGSKLKKVVHTNIGNIEGPDKGFTKVIEEPGKCILSGLKKSDPFASNICQYNTKCNADTNTDCSQSRCVYLVECTRCQDSVDNVTGTKYLYTGTTGCSLHKRLNEHSLAVSRNDPKNALAKHSSKFHPSLPPEFSTSILDRQK